MANHREFLRLSSLQYSQRTIESMAHCSRHTVRDVLQAAKEQGIRKACKMVSEQNKPKEQEKSYELLPPSYHRRKRKAILV